MQPLRTLHLFAGAGGGLLADILVGHQCVCAVEIDPYCQQVLAARQADGCLPWFPIFADVVQFDGRLWRGHVDVVSGGFPCTDISSAGLGAGITGPESGLWTEFARIIGEVEPAYAFIENSPYLRTRGLVTVLKDLAGMGFDARWGVLGADAVGAPHLRRRLWIVAAHPDRHGQRDVRLDAEVAGAQADARAHEPSQIADADREPLREQPGRRSGACRRATSEPGDADWWPVDLIQGVDDGLANRVDRVRATGNGQIPAVAALAWETLTHGR